MSSPARSLPRILRHHRRRLTDASALLERRVVERTADLAAANAALRAAAAAQAALRDELVVRDRLVTAGMLTAGINHELRSPLTVISIAVAELADALPPDAPAERRAVIADLAAAAAQIAVIVGELAGDLAAGARPVADVIEPVELAPVIAAAVRQAGYHLGRGVVVARGPVTAAPVLANRARLVQVFLNLLINAARAARPGAAGTIAVAAVDDDQADAVVVTVTDDGVGMSVETQARLFEPFFTTGADRGGTGLGLSICRTILARLGGTIAVRSALGRGTTVEVRLRRAC